MPPPLMPKATAVWLVDNTTLTFDQIAEFCGLHALEIQAVADGEVAQGIIGLDPITNSQLTQAEIDRCAADPTARLEMAEVSIPRPTQRAKGPRYTPVSKRQDRPDAIAWILRHCADLSDPQICRLIRTTKPTINAIRDRSHWNASNLKPRNPVHLGLCTQQDLDAALAKAAKTAARKAEKDSASAPPAAEVAASTDPAPGFAPQSGPEPEPGL